MVAHLVRLRLDLSLGAFRGGAAAAARAVGAVLAVAVATALLVVVADRAAPATLFAGTVLIGASMVVAVLVAPVVTGAVDAMDPRRFVVFGLPARSLAGALLLSALPTWSTLAGVVVLVAFAGAWIAAGTAPLVAVAAAVLAGCTVLLCVQVALAVGALSLQRRSRELTGLVVLGALTVIIPAGMLALSFRGDGSLPTAVAPVVEVLAVTPIGAVFALATPFASGWSWVVAVVTVLALLGGWFAVVDRALHAPARPATAQERRGLGWFNVLPATATGAIAARSITYWLADARYLVSIGIVPFAGAVTVLPLLVVGVPAEIALLVPAPVIALLLGWAAHNDLAHDSTALWMHISAGVRGSADRAGRLAPVLLVGVPTLAVSVAVVSASHPDGARLLPLMAGACAALFFGGLGVSSVSSVLAPYAAARPGDGPFEQPQRTNGSLAQACSLLCTLLVAAPVLWQAWIVWSADVVDVEAAVGVLWWGIGVGALALAVGILLGGAVFRLRAGALMEFALSS